MNMVLAAGFVYAMMTVYLFMRGVPARMIARILAAALIGGLLLAYTLGMAYFFIVLVRPAETISVFAIAMLLVSASYTARERILGTITPLGIVFLNIAANFAAPGSGPLPLSFAWLAQHIPVPWGPLRVALNLLVLYWPALLALAALRKGPPGHPMVRLVLGAWVCWVGIAALAGPGWQAMSKFQLDNPALWLGAVAASYASLHLAMLTLNFFFIIADKEQEGARSIARSIKVDVMPPLIALALGVLFWAGVYLLMRLPWPGEYKASLAIAAAFALGALARQAPVPAPAPLPSPPPRGSRHSFRGWLTALPFAAFATFLSSIILSEQERRARVWEAGEPFDHDDRTSELMLLGTGSIVVLFAAALACTLYEGVTHRRARRWLVLPAAILLFAVYRINHMPPEALGYLVYGVPPASLAGLPVDPKTGQTKRRSAGITFNYLHDHDAFAARLMEAGVPFEVSPRMNDQRLITVKRPHVEAAQRVAEQFERTPPPKRSASFLDARQRALTQWLDAKGVTWEVVQKQGRDWVQWQDSTPGGAVLRAFEKGEKAAWLGIDYYALDVVAPALAGVLDPASAAAFETPEQRQAFLAWLDRRGMKHETLKTVKHEFIVWEPPGGDLLSRYVEEMRRYCREEARQRSGDSAPGVVEKRC